MIDIRPTAWINKKPEHQRPGTANPSLRFDPESYSQRTYLDNRFQSVLEGLSRDLDLHRKDSFKPTLDQDKFDQYRSQVE